MNRDRFLFLSIIFVIGMIALHFGSTYQHELIHKTIYKRYGLESNITIIYNPITMVKMGISGRTIAYGNNTCNADCNKLQSEAEIIGYNNEITHNYILFGIFMVLLIVYYTKEHDKP